MYERTVTYFLLQLFAHKDILYQFLLMELLGQRLYTFNVVVDTPTLPSKEASPIYTPGNGASLGNCSNSQFMPITWQPGPSKLWSFDLHFFNYGRELISLIME